MKVVVVLLTLAACEHAGPTPSPKPDPIKQAHDEFELLPAAASAGTSELYERGAFAPGSGAAAFDEGDFIGRLRTLFGPRDGDTYVLRYKKTGVVITAYCDPLPWYGGMAADAGLAARRAAGFDSLTRQEDDAIAGPNNAAAIIRLDDLVSAVAPADFAEITYDDAEPSVWRIGAKGGHSFRDELPVSEGMSFLLGRLRNDSYEPDVAVIEFYLEHYDEDDVIADKPKVLAALSHFATLAKHVDDAEKRAELADQVRDYTEQFR